MALSTLVMLMDCCVTASSPNLQITRKLTEAIWFNSGKNHAASSNDSRRTDTCCAIGNVDATFCTMSMSKAFCPEVRNVLDIPDIRFRNLITKFHGITWPLWRKFMPHTLSLAFYRFHKLLLRCDRFCFRSKCNIFHVKMMKFCRFPLFETSVVPSPVDKE